jgi:deoxyribonuclease V
MHIAVDVYYGSASATGACVGFARVDDERPAFVVTETFAGAASDYQPGDFKTRELPYLLKLFELARERTAAMDVDIDTVIVDGYAWLDGGRPGLGGHLAAVLHGDGGLGGGDAGAGVAIIGVAKTRFHGADAVEVLRGQSQSPLFVSSSGIEPLDAAAFVRAMHGEHRLPTMLRIVDHASRGLPVD